MLKDLLRIISAALREYGVSHVYTMFNELSPDQRSKEIYTLIGIESYEISSSFFSYDMIYMPYKADIDIKLTAAVDTPLSELYEYFDEYVLPAMISITGIKSLLKCISTKYDSNIDRLVFTARFSASGIIKMERSD